MSFEMCFEFVFNKKVNSSSKHNSNLNSKCLYKLGLRLMKNKKHTSNIYIYYRVSFLLNTLHILRNYLHFASNWFFKIIPTSSRTWHSPDSRRRCIQGDLNSSPLGTITKSLTIGPQPLLQDNWLRSHALRT